MKCCVCLNVLIGSSFLGVQILFGILYIINLGIILTVYVKTDVVWNKYIPYAGGVIFASRA